MAPATIQLILGVLDIWLPLMCLLLVVVALFLLYLHRDAKKPAIAASPESPQRARMLGKDIPMRPPFVLQSTPGSTRRTRQPWPNSVGSVSFSPGATRFRPSLSGTAPARIGPKGWRRV